MAKTIEISPGHLLSRDTALLLRCRRGNVSQCIVIIQTYFKITLLGTESYPMTISVIRRFRY